MTVRTRSLILLFLTAFFWSFGGVLIKMIPLPPLAIAGVRSLIAGLVLLAYKRRFNFHFSKLQILCVACFTGTVILFVTATKLTSAANAILLQYTAPLFVALLGEKILHEKVSKQEWSVIAIAGFGLVIFFWDSMQSHHWLGDLIAIGSGICFAGVAICLRLQKGQSDMESLLLGHGLTALLGLPFLFTIKAWPGVNVFWLIPLGVFQLGIPYIMYGMALRNVTALEATLVPILEPVLNPIWVALVIGEWPSHLSMLGGGLVILAVTGHGVLRAHSQYRNSSLT